MSRALSRLERGKVIRFAEKCRRDIQIPDLSALTEFIQGGCARPAGVTVQ